MDHGLARCRSLGICGCCDAPHSPNPLSPASENFFIIAVPASVLLSSGPMDTARLDELKQWFAAFVDGYREPDGSLHSVHTLKWDHSRRVADECREIATDLGWGPDDVNTAEALGTLHDVARFPQYEQYRTLVDRDSVNHGKFGYDLVRERGILDACTPEDREAILDGIRFHNLRSVPDALPPRVLRFVRLIRDADKLDILHIVEVSLRDGAVKRNPEILLNIDVDGPATPELVQQILREKTGSYENVKSLADMNLMRMTWMYDINYLPCLRRIVDRGLLDGLKETIPAPVDPGVHRIIRAARDYVNERLREGRMELSS